jgi:ribonuclease J
MKVKVHRSKQIGGCITEIRSDKGTKIIIDVGSNLPGTASEDVPVGELTEDCAGVLISHYHGDHIGDFDKVLPGVDIYSGKVAKEIFLALQKELNEKRGIGNPELVENFRTFSIGRPFTLPNRNGDMEITPLMVDHSAFDAYMFLIECEGKRVLYTGDFRTHGPRGAKLLEVLKAYASNIDLLIIEGTMLSRNIKNTLTEHQLGREAKRLMREEKYKNTFLWCSSTNIDTIAEFYHATPGDRPFIADGYQQEILRIVKEHSRSPFYDFGKKGKIYTYSEKNTKLHEWMKDKGFCMLIRPTYLLKKALERFPDNLLVYSMWEGYLEEGKPYADKDKINFLKEAEAGGSTIEYLHTSGHATEDAICKVCEVVGARKIFPIHGERPERFKELQAAGKINGEILESAEEVNPCSAR